MANSSQTQDTVTVTACVFEARFLIQYAKNVETYLEIACDIFRDIGYFGFHHFFNASLLC